MDHVVDICQFCRSRLIDLLAIGAYFNVPANWERLGRSLSRVPIVPHFNDAPRFPLTRLVTDFRSECPVCRLILDEIPEYGDFGSLRAVAFCAEAPDMALLENLRVSATSLGMRTLGRRRFFPITFVAAHPIYCNQIGENTYERGKKFRVFVNPEHDDKLNRYISGWPVCPPGSDINMARLRVWLTSCVKSHAVCRKGLSGVVHNDRRNNTGLPRRLIYVGVSDDARPESRPRIVKTRGARGTYAALSYCWESAREINSAAVLYKATIIDLMKSIPVQDLPPSIKDAIEVTRSIGIQYLWVDRLCIVQDDEKELAADCAEMCNIYDGAIVTLVALGDGVRPGQGGLFLDRAIQDHLQFDQEPGIGGKLTCSIGGKELGTVYVGKKITVDDSKSGLAEELGRAKWDTRGWTFQEGLLSRRLVYFGNRQLYWECQEEILNEDGTPNDRFAYGSYLYRSGAELGLSKRRLESNLRNRDIERIIGRVIRLFKHDLGSRMVAAEAYDTWTRIVQAYSLRNLSMEQDKLRAIDGIAQALKIRLSLEDYFYGTWMNCLAVELLWLGVEDLTPPKRFRAPSWSWAAWDGHINFPSIEPPGPLREFRSLLSESEFLRAGHAESSGSSTAAPPLQPTLKLKGKIAQGRCVALDTWDSRLPRFGLGGPRLLDQKEVSQTRGNVALVVDDKTCGIVQYDGEPQVHEHTTAFLLVAQDTWEKKWKSHPERSRLEVYYLLALEKVENEGQSNVYRRVGLGEAIWYPGGEENLGWPLHERRDTAVLLV